MRYAAGIALLFFPASAVALAQQMDHPMPGMDHSMPGMAMPHAKTPAAAPPAAASGTDRAAGDGKAPPPPADHAADAYYDPAAMAQARAQLRGEHGGMRVHRISFNLAELQVRNGREGYRWDGEGWFGGDIDRLVVRTEGEGDPGGRLDRGEVQALYSHAIDPWFDLQGGVRQDVGHGPRRSYATIGIEGLAPYWFDVEARLFLSQRGDLLARAEAIYDQRLTQRLVLQPRVELNFAAQDVPANRIGSGLSSAELGLRLRYEVVRQWAPYVGVSWERAVGDSARYARAAGEDAASTSLVIGIRSWF